MSRRFLLTFIILVSSFCFFTTELNAAATPENVLTEHIDAVKSGSSLEPFLGKFGRNANFVGFLDGLVDLENAPRDVLEGRVSDASRNWIPGGLVGSTNQLTAQLFNPPASGVQYIASTWNSFLGKPAYAQGTGGVGFIGLQPILPIWRAFRNAIYILSSVLFIIVGIMVMLRVKISAQAVVTLQNAIPQIITTLILVTFSYAIAGLIIDLLTLFQGFVLATLFSAKGISLSDSLFKNFPNLSSTQFPLAAQYLNYFNFKGISETGFMHFFTMSFMLVPVATLLFFSSATGYIIGSIIGVLGGSPVSMVIGGIAGFGIGAVIIMLIIICMIIFWMIKFFFGALKCYVTAIFKIIIAPLEIAMGAFPNSKVGFSTWIWDLVGNLAVFPISVLFLVVANLIIEASSSSLWAPSLIGGQLLNVPAVASGGIVGAFIGIGALMLISQLPILIPQAMFMLKPTAWENAIGKQLSETAATPGVMFGRAAGTFEGYNKLRKGYFEAEAARRQVRTLPNTSNATNVAGNNPPTSSGNTTPPAGP